MYDLTIHLENKPGSLANLGNTLGNAGVGIEGGGVFTADGVGHAHFLFRNGKKAQSALKAAGIDVVSSRKVVVLRLQQGVPGQLGALAQMMAESDVNIEVQYSDHDNQLVLVTDKPELAQKVAAVWARRTGRVDQVPRGCCEEKL